MSQGEAGMDIRTFHPEDPEGLVKGLFGCIDGRDWSGLSEFLHDEAIYERPGYEPFVGKPAILDFYLQIPAHRGQSFRRIADSIPVIADSF